MRRRSAHRLGAGILAGTLVAVAVAACSLVAGLDKLQFSDAGACATPCTLAPNPCVQGGCLSGNVCQPQLLPVNTPCTTPGDAGGACTDAGSCFQTCATNDDCAVQNPCVVSACDLTNRWCVYTNVADQTPTPNAKPVYCNAHVCINGQDVLVVDDDAAPPQIECNTSSCLDGGVMTQPVAYHTACGPDGGQTCNDGGMCGCTSDLDCTAPETCGPDGGTPGFCGCIPQTCMSLGKTCGGPFPDGCFDVLYCNDGMKNGTETGIDCGGDPTTCPNRCPNGDQCDGGTDCDSGLCSPQNVCCNGPCTDDCRSCAVDGSAGMCTNVGYNQSNPGLCPGPKMACDGDGHCLKANGTSCNTNSGCIDYCNTKGVCE